MYSVLTGVIIVLLFVLLYYINEDSIYKDKYKWYSQQYGKARHELTKLEGKLKEAQQAKGKQTITINVVSDEVVSKFMSNINKDIEAMKKQERVFIRVDGNEMNINELTRVMKKAGEKLK